MITIHINATEAGTVHRELVDRALREVFRREGVVNGEFSVTFVSDAEIASLHGRYLSCPDVTDVLSFALHSDGEEPLGDVYVGHGCAERQASEAGDPLEEELARLAVHGALHVLGYDHPEGPERGDCEMFRVQEEVLRKAVRT